MTAPKTPEEPAAPMTPSAPPPPVPAAESEREPLSPTRYGDWVKNGIAIDF